MPLAPRTRRLLALAGLSVGGALVVAGAVLGYEVAFQKHAPAPPPRAPDRPPGGDGLSGGALGVRLVRVAGGFTQPTDIQFSPTRPTYLVVLQKQGKATIARFDRDAAERAPIVTGPPAGEPGAARPHGFFEVAVRSESEMGLLGLAFHPRFAESGRFFVHYNPAGPTMKSRIAEWHVDPAHLDDAPPREVRVLLEIDQPFANHKGGQLAFGPDGMLYAGFGDGGSGGDPRGNAQRLDTLLGKMLRLDVDRAEEGRPYAIPADNPFIGRKGARPEIWAHGLRNPWRFSFDGRGRLVVADVGQDLWEEVDVVTRGANLGWNVREGRHCYQGATCGREGLIDPVWEYGHDTGASITGGYVYEGTRAPTLRGKWLVGDFVFRRIWALTLAEEATGEAEPALVGQSDLMLSTFGRAPDGEVYAVDFMSGNLYGFAAEAGR